MLKIDVTGTRGKRRGVPGAMHLAGLETEIQFFENMTYLVLVQLAIVRRVKTTDDRHVSLHPI